MTTIIVEDEMPAVQRMKQLLLKHHDKISLSDVAMTGDQAIEKINKLQPDCIFLDIQLPDMNGFEVLAQLSYNPYVIFATAYHEFALKAFEFHSIDYLLKPIEQERFDKAILKLYDLNVSKSNLAQQLLSQFFKKEQLEKTSFSIKLNDRILLIDFEDLKYFKAEDKYIRVYTDNNKKYLISKTMTQLEAELPSSFIRIHRSLIVNKNYVVELQKSFKSRFRLILKDNTRTQLTSSSSYVEVIKTNFGLI